MTATGGRQSHAERVRREVPIAGSRGGEAPLSWGQAAIWAGMVRNGQTWNLTYVLDLPDLRVDVPAACAALAVLLERHEALRTVVRGTDAARCQVVLEAGSLPVEVLACGADKAVGLIRSLLDKQRDLAFAYATELPLRVTLVAVNAIVQHIVLTYCHLAVDYTAMRFVHDDLMNLLSTGVPAFETGAQPLDIVRYEQSAAGVRASARAVRFWGDQLERLPTTMWSPVGPPREPRLQHAVLTSPTLHSAARRIASRHRTTPSTVVLAAGMMVLGAWTGHSVVALNLMAANRSRPGYRQAVANLVQLGLIVVDLPAGATLDEVVPATARATLRAQQYAYYDYTELSGVRARIDAERGAEVNPLACFNAEDNSFDASGEQEEERPPAESTVTWRTDVAVSRCHFCLRLGERFGGSQGVSLTADSSRLPPERIEAYLRELEGLVSATAQDKNRSLP